MNITDENERFKDLFKDLFKKSSQECYENFEKQLAKTQNMNDTLDYWTKAIKQAGFKIENYTIKEK